MCYKTFQIIMYSQKITDEILNSVDQVSDGTWWVDETCYNQCKS